MQEVQDYTHDITNVLYFSLGVIGLPSSSIAFSILNAARMEAIDMNIYLSSKSDTKYE